MALYRPIRPINHLTKLIQYGAKLLVPILQARARLQYRAGVRSHPTSSIAPRLTKLASTISSARALWGLWGTCNLSTRIIAYSKSSSRNALQQASYP